MNIGDVIKKYRKDNGLSLQAFADRCEYSKGYIAMLERNLNSRTGKPVAPTLETFVKVSSAMGISLSNLLKMVDENQPISFDETEALDNMTIKKGFMDKYDRLNPAGKKKAEEYLDDLLDNPKYKEGLS